MTTSPRSGWTLAIVSIALFMTALDNLVVGVALPSIRVDLGGSIESLEWTVNAYTLAFAVLLITGAAAALAVVKMLRPRTNIRLRPKRSPSAAPVTSSTANASV